MALNSMTGYGRYGVSPGPTVEIRTVNHRHLDIHCRLPKAWLALEAEVKALVSSTLSRGRVEIGIFSERRDEASGFAIDTEQTGRYLAWADAQRQDGGVERVVDLAAILALPGALTATTQSIDPDADREPLLAAVAGATQAVAAMRREEGEALCRDMAGRLDVIAAAVERLRERRVISLDESHNKLRQRIAELVDQVDPQRLAQEAALLVDRSDISEELTRLDSHLSQFREGLASDQPVGRTLDFLTIELNREANTIGAKCQDAGMSREVVFIKGELEKVREQVQNVE